MNVHGIGSANHKSALLFFSSLPQGGESLLVKAEFSAGFATASSGPASFATSTSLSTATASASFTSTSPWLLLAFFSLRSRLPGLPWWPTLTLLTTSTPTASATSFTTATTSTAAVASAASTLVSKGEVDVKLLLSRRSLKVDDSLLFFLLIFFLILLLVDSRLLPLGVNVGSLASFPQVELRSILLSLQLLPLVQGHLLLLLFPGKLCLKLFGSEFSGSLGLLLNSGFFLAFGVNSSVSLLALLGYVVLKGSPVTLATASSLVFSLDSSSVVPGLPVIVPLATPSATLTASTATTFSSTATSAHLASSTTTASSTVTGAIVV